MANRVYNSGGNGRQAQELQFEMADSGTFTKIVAGAAQQLQQVLQPAATQSLRRRHALFPLFANHP